jgi:hypothetical protein
MFSQFERFRGARCDCTMGKRIQRGRMLAAQKGYWTGGNPPYGTRRLLLDKNGNPLHLLKPGQRKTVKSHRVTLVEGEPAEVAAVRRIFHEFVDLGYSMARIAEGLNAKRVPSPGRGPWSARKVLACLRTKAYASPITYRRKGKRKTSRRGKTPDRWVHTPEASEGLISLEQFQRAQEMLP